MNIVNENNSVQKILLFGSLANFVLNHKVVCFTCTFLYCYITYSPLYVKWDTESKKGFRIAVSTEISNQSHLRLDLDAPRTCSSLDATFKRSTSNIMQ